MTFDEAFPHHVDYVLMCALGCEGFATGAREGFRHFAKFVKNKADFSFRLERFKVTSNINCNCYWSEKKKFANLPKSAVSDAHGNHGFDKLKFFASQKDLLPIHYQMHRVVCLQKLVVRGSSALQAESYRMIVRVHHQNIYRPLFLWLVSGSISSPHWMPSERNIMPCWRQKLPARKDDFLLMFQGAIGGLQQRSALVMMVTCQIVAGLWGLE